jgi:hypothetical protein
MSRRIPAMLALFATLGLATPARAAEITVFINFDVDINGVLLESPAIIDELYAPWGVTFSATAGSSCSQGEIYATSACLSGAAPASPPNIVSTCSGCTDIAEQFQGLVVATFAMPADSVCITAIPFGPKERCVLRAYDEAHTLLMEVLTDPEVTSQVLCVAAPAIHSVEFSGYQDLYGWFDDLQVSFAPVAVAPATWSGVKARAGEE